MGNPYDHVRDTFTGGCRRGMSTGLSVDATGSVVIVPLPCRTIFEVQWARFEREQREAAAAQTRLTKREMVK